ncbi:MAG: hypothetical protein Kow00124_18410 [Anaerolineae bacterium]
MGFFKRLFGGGEPKPKPDEGLYLYIRLDRRGEVVRLRLNPSSDMNRDYETGDLLTHKTIVGPRTFERAEADLRFDSSHRLIEWEISGGELVGEEEWQAQQAARASSPPADA